MPATGKSSVSSDQSVVLRYAGAAMAALAALGVRMALDPVMGSQAPYVPFIIAIVVASRYGGRGPGLAATAISAAAVAWFYLQPLGSLAIADPNAAAGLALFVLAGVIISFIVGRLHKSLLSAVREEPAPRQTEEQISPWPSTTAGRFADRKLKPHHLWLGAAVLLLAIEALLFFGTWTRFAERESLSTSTREAIAKIESLLSVLKDAETGQRGYLLTGRDYYLEPYNMAVREIPGRLDEARTRERRKRAEAALRNSEREFRKLAESIPQLVWMTDGEGETIYCNTRFQQQLGVGSTPRLEEWAELLHPDDREPCVTAWEQCLKAAKEFQRECRFRMASGEYRWFLLRAIPVEDDEGRVTRWFGTSTDIDDQKRSQEQLTKANLELARSNSILEQFAYIASHDLQEPLRTVAVYVQLLADKCEGQLDASADEYVQIVHDGAIRMKRLINDLLIFSRAGRDDQALLATNLDDVLDEVLRNLGAHVAETGATITSSALPVVMADFGQLVQLLQNLIGNALKYRKDDALPVIDISAEQQQDDWVVAVRDNGIGINSRHFEQIFKIFERLHTRAKHDGTGIGLAICERIVKRHKGRLWVESAEGTGATFYFTIPMPPNGVPPRWRPAHN